eukprot:scaffold285505_cov31-Tisochrysis_lutea.AAC.2
MNACVCAVAAAVPTMYTCGPTGVASTSCRWDRPMAKQISARQGAASSPPAKTHQRRSRCAVSRHSVAARLAARPWRRSSARPSART